MIKKITIIGILTAFVFILSYPVVARAEVAGANSQIPALNPFCWKRKDCIEMRRKYVTGDISDDELAKNGFVSNNSVAPCNIGTGDDQWGRCLPAGVSKTEIDFGGRSEFANIGDFILLMYKYLVTTASIVAVIMIIVAGIQWITSGGNSEAISSAKHRIGGAVVGLFIAYMSYFILNTINPNLVNFRLPQVWLVRSQELMPTFCTQIPNADKIKFAYVGTWSASSTMPKNPENIEYKYEITDKKAFACGNNFLAENGGGLSCLGNVCDQTPLQTNICLPNGVFGSDTLAQCTPGFFVVKISNSNFLNKSEGGYGFLNCVKAQLGVGPIYKFPYVLDSLSIGGGGPINALSEVCNNKTTGKRQNILQSSDHVKTIAKDDEKKVQYLTLPGWGNKAEGGRAADWNCKDLGHGDSEGFVLFLYLNTSNCGDDAHITIGKNGKILPSDINKWDSKDFFSIQDLQSGNMNILNINL